MGIDLPINALKNLIDFHSFNFILKAVLVYIAFFWIALIIWVTRDSINRSNNLIFQILSISLNIFLPLFGLVIYLIIRPNKTLLEKYYEDIEYQALASEASVGSEFCVKCRAGIDKKFVYCPYCNEKLKTTCAKCKKNISRKWKICPYCGTEQEEFNAKKKKKKKK